MDDPRPPWFGPLRFQLVIALGLLCALVALGFVFDFGGDGRPVLEGDMNVSPDGGSRHLDAEGNTSIRYSPTFELTRPSTLEVEIRRGEVPGWLHVGVGLVDEGTAEVREFGLSTRWNGERGDLTASGRLDRVKEGRYTLRFDPRWEPTAGEPDPVDVQLRVYAGTRTLWPFTLAATLIILPPVVTFLRARHVQRRA